MQTHAGKNQTKASRATATFLSKRKSVRNAAFQTTADHPDAVVQRERREKINNSLQIRRQQALQDAIEASPYMAAQRQAQPTSLPGHLKAGLESLSGYAMDDVAVHYNSAKPAGLHARAFAQGTNIHLAPGQENYLPHESWHVVQQKQGRVRPTGLAQGKVVINDDEALESEADAMGAKSLQTTRDAQSDVARRGLTRNPVAQRRIVVKANRPSGAIGGRPVQLSGWRFLGALGLSKGYRWGKRKDARNAARKIARNSAPLAPMPFRVANFAFASSHGGMIGSLYFTNGGVHQRMRLTHGGGPEIGGAHANAVWYFPVGDTWPKRANGRPRKIKADINAWRNGPPRIPDAPKKGRRVVEYWGGNAVRFGGSHPSRGTVTRPGLKQTDLNVIHQAIAGGADNNLLRQRILNYGLSRKLRQ